MNYKKSYIILNIGTISGLAFEALGDVFDSVALMAIGLAVILGSVLQMFCYLRRPCCGGLLNIREWGLPNYCPDCGTKLD